MYAYPALSSRQQQTSRTQTSASKSSNKSSSGGGPERGLPLLRTHLHSHNCPRASFRRQLVKGANLGLTSGGTAAAVEDLPASSFSQERLKTPFELSKASADVTVPLSTLLPSSVACTATQAHQLPTIFSTHDYVEEIVPFSAVAAAAGCGTSGTNGNFTLTDSFLAGNLEALQRHRPEHDSMAEREYSHSHSGAKSGKSGFPLSRVTAKSKAPSSLLWRIFRFCCCLCLCSSSGVSGSRREETAALTSKGCPACTYHRAVRRRRRMLAQAASSKSALIAQLTAKQQQMAAAAAQQGVIEYDGHECLSSSSAAAQLVVQEASTSEQPYQSVNGGKSKSSKCSLTLHERQLDLANSLETAQLLTNGSPLTCTASTVAAGEVAAELDSSIYTIVIKLAQRGECNEATGEQVNSCAASVKMMMPASVGTSLNGAANGAAPPAAALPSNSTLPASLSTDLAKSSKNINNLPASLTVMESSAVVGSIAQHQQSGMTISTMKTTASALALSHPSTVSMGMSGSVLHSGGSAQTTHSFSQRAGNCEMLNLMMQVATGGANSLEEDDYEEEDNFCANCDLDDLTDTDDDHEPEVQTQVAEEDQEEECMSAENGEGGGEAVRRANCCFCFTRGRRGGGNERSSDSNEPSTMAMHSGGEAVLRAHSASIPPQNKWDSKAAKTLSAILLAFIITWTPYNVLGK